MWVRFLLVAPEIMKKPRTKVGPWRTVFRGTRFEIKQAEATYSSGRKDIWEKACRAPTVFVLALDDKGKLLLTKEYRYVSKRYEWFLPVGKMDKEANPKKAAMRELQEEAGFKAKKLTLLSRHGALTLMEHERYIFLAEGLTPAPIDAGEDEDIVVYPTTVKKALQMVLEGEIDIPEICFAIITLNKYLRSKKIKSKK